MEEPNWKPPKRPLPGASEEVIKTYKKELDRSNSPSLESNTRLNQEKKGDKIKIVLFVLFILIIVGIFTNWFGLGKQYKTPKINLDCSKSPDKYSPYCSEEFESNYQEQMDKEPGRSINP